MLIVGRRQRPRFLDADYNGDAFFVRRAYFTDADDPTTACAKFFAPRFPTKVGCRQPPTVSRVFNRPKSAKIAVKVINNYGDEIM